MTNEAFHFLRPEWLWALLGLPLIAVWIRRGQDSAGAWRKVCDPELLPHLLQADSRVGLRWPAAALAVGGLGTVFALAGPTWQRLPEIAYEEPTQTVAVLQLTPSMHARDIAPNRLDRARYELQDMLAESQGTVGLVIFAEEAYGVTPLTDDPRVIDEVVPTLDPRLMPGRGARLDRGIAEAHRLLENAGALSGRIVLLADGPGDAPGLSEKAAARAAAAGYPVSAMSLHPDAEILGPVVEAGGGRLSHVEAGDGDIKFLLGIGAAGADDFQPLEESGLEADTWQDAGATLLWLPLLLAPFAFRRGWAGSLGLWLIFLVSQPQPAQAEIADWFSRPDQRGAAAFAAGEHGEATRRFEDPEWRGVAAYREGDLDQAIEALSSVDDGRAQYNLGNALAQSGRLEEALVAYESVLEKENDHEDARFNRELVARLLEEQKKQQDQPEEKPGQEQGGQEQGEQEQGEQEQGEQEQGGQEQGEQEQGEQEQGEQEQGGQEQGEPEKEQQEQAQPQQGEGGSDSQGQEEDSSPENSEEQSQDPSQGKAEGRHGSEGQPPENSQANGAESVDSPSAQSGAQEQTNDEDEGLTENSNPRERRGPMANADPPKADSPAGRDADPVAAAERVPMSEEEQEIEQWLSRVPDEPGGLLREKLRRRYAEKRRGYGARQGGPTW